MSTLTSIWEIPTAIIASVLLVLVLAPIYVAGDGGTSKVALVLAGDGPVTVVCGAPNARAGLVGVLGLSYGQSMQYVIAPQAMPRRNTLSSP